MAEISLRQVCYEANIQAKEIGRSKGLATKWFWIIFLLLSGGIFIHQIYNTVTAYMEYPIIITYKEKHINDESLQFPRLVICGRSPLDYAALHAYKYPNALISLLSTSFFDEDHPVATGDFEDQLRQFRRWSSTFSPRFKLLSFLQNVTISAKDTFPACYVNYDRQDCTSFMDGYVDLDYCGKCFRMFNISNVRQLVPGKRGKVRLHMHRDILSVSNRLVEMSELEMAFEIRFLPVMDNFDIDGSDVVTTLPGKRYEIKLTKKVTLRKVRVDCQKSSFRTEEGMFEICRRNCEGEELQKIFNCTVVGTFINPSEPELCDLGNLSMEAHKTRIKVNCSQCSKAVPCRTVSFMPIVTTAPTFNTSAADAIVDIYFTDLKELVLEEHFQMSLAWLLGTLGGQASLLLGFKIATFIQLGFYACIWIKNKIIKIGQPVFHDKPGTQV